MVTRKNYSEILKKNVEHRVLMKINKTPLMTAVEDKDTPTQKSRAGQLIKIAITPKVSLNNCDGTKYYSSVQIIFWELSS